MACCWWHYRKHSLDQLLLHYWPLLYVMGPLLMPSINDKPWADGGYESACMETQAMAAFSFLNWLMRAYLYLFFHITQFTMVFQLWCWTSSFSPSLLCKPTVETPPSGPAASPTSIIQPQGLPRQKPNLEVQSFLNNIPNKYQLPSLNNTPNNWQLPYLNNIPDRHPHNRRTPRKCIPHLRNNNRRTPLRCTPHRNSSLSCPCRPRSEFILVDSFICRRRIREIFFLVCYNHHGLFTGNR